MLHLHQVWHLVACDQRLESVFNFRVALNQQLEEQGTLLLGHLGIYNLLLLRLLLLLDLLWRGWRLVHLLLVDGHFSLTDFHILILRGH